MSGKKLPISGFPSYLFFALSLTHLSYLYIWRETHSGLAYVYETWSAARISKYESKEL